MPRSWTFAHVVALVELACGLFVLAYGFATEAELAGGAGRSPLDRLFLPLLGAVVGGGLIVTGVRSWRAGQRQAGQEPAAPQGAPAGPLPRPALSPEGRQELERVVVVLAAAGVFAPRPPEPAQLSEAVADAGEPVLAEAVLMAGEEAAFWHPGFRSSEHSDNLAFHDSHVEQFADVLQAQVDDVVRLTGGGHADVSVAIEVGEPEGTGRVPTRLRLTVDGEERVLDYPGAPKYLSTVLHVALAGVARERRSDRRLAWLWSDQGVWLSGLPDGAVERLNADLGPAAGEGWEWVDEQPPTAAGEMYPAGGR